MDSRAQQQMSAKASDMAGQAQLKRADEAMSHGSANSQQSSQDASSMTDKASNFLHQTGEQVMNMAAGAADAVKNTLGMNNPDNSSNPSAGSNPSANSAANTTTTAATATNPGAATISANHPSNPTSTRIN